MKETWTHDFFLLAMSNASITPTFQEANALISAGLGKKRLVFPDKNGDFNHFKEVLEQNFPQFNQNGAFKVLRADRGGASRPLFPIPLPASGYSIPFLKNCVGSAMIYIRPMQGDLSTQPILSNTTAGGATVTTTCINCHHAIAICEIREHVKTCGGSSSKSDLEVLEIDDNDSKVGTLDDKEKDKEGNINGH